MRRFPSYLHFAFFVLFLIPGAGFAQLKNGWHNPYEKEIWYKRYSGTIDGNPVVVNLLLWDNHISGSYNFVNKSDQVQIGINNKDISRDGSLTVYGFAPNPTFSDTAGSKSVLVFKGENIKGEWESANHKHNAKIELKEEYPEGSYPFDLEILKDSVLVKNDVFGLYSTFKIPVPGEKMNKTDAEWFEKALVQQLGGADSHAKNMNEYISASNKNEFAEYKKLMDDTLASAENYYLIMDIEPWYNSHGIAVLKADYYVAIPQVATRESYYCFDMEQKKVLHLSDIMDVDTAKLDGLLEKDMKLWYSPMHPEYQGPYATVSNNIYVDDFGITFLFGNNDYFNTPCFFVPYSKIKDMLKPDFKRRMKL